MGSLAGTFSATGQSGSFVANPRKALNFTISGGNAQCQIERSFDGTNWYVVLTDSLRQSLPESFSISESESDVSYRINCTQYTSGPVTWRISQ